MRLYPNSCALVCSLYYCNNKHMEGLISRFSGVSQAGTESKPERSQIYTSRPYLPGCFRQPTDDSAISVEPPLVQGTLVQMEDPVGSVVLSACGAVCFHCLFRPFSPMAPAADLSTEALSTPTKMERRNKAVTKTVLLTHLWHSGLLSQGRL